MKINYEFNQDKMEKNKKEIIKKLKENPAILRWLDHFDLNSDFIDDNCMKFVEFLNTINVCKKCEGLSECKYAQRGKPYDLIYQNGILDFVQIKCRYLRQKEEKFSHKKNIVVCDMSDNQLLLSFKDIDVTRNDIDLLEFMTFINEELINKEFNEFIKGLYLYGAPGIGKTFLMCCFVNKMAKENKKCSFVNVPILISKIKNNISDKKSFSKILGDIKKSDIVVFDDIGGECQSAWERDDILLPLLNYRMENNKLTFFTSNYSIEQLLKFYQVDKNSENDYIASLRLIERIKALSDTKQLYGESQRK